MALGIRDILMFGRDLRLTNVEPVSRPKMTPRDVIYFSVDTILMSVH